VRNQRFLRPGSSKLDSERDLRWMKSFDATWKKPLATQLIRPRGQIPSSVGQGSLSSGARVSAGVAELWGEG
jgi:hypothetical protein